MIGRWLVFLALTFVFLGYLMYQPLPPGTQRPWKLRLVTFLTEAMFTITHMIEKMTGTPVAEQFAKATVPRHPPEHLTHPDLEIENTVWDGIPVRVFRPKAVKDLSPCVIYFHGGGWVVFDIDTYHDNVVQLALETKMIVAAVSYRKAPKHPYPTAFEDCVKATVYLLREGTNFGVDVNRVAVAGDSAGGNLAAAVSLRLSQEDPAVIPPLKLQVLVCPVLQALSFDLPSYRENGNWYLTKGAMVFFWAAYLGLDLQPETYSTMLKNGHVSPSIQRSIYSSYLGKQKGKVNENYDRDMAAKLDSLVVEPFLSPLLADDVSKVAPAYVVAFELDILRDEAVLYSERLKKAGVKTDLYIGKGMPHIIVYDHHVKRMMHNDEYAEIYTKIADYVKKAL